MCTAVRRCCSPASTSTIRSWVSGRGGTTPSWAFAIAEASFAPIQMGRKRLPPTSRSSTIGALDGISTRTPTTSSSRMGQPYVRQPDLRRDGSTCPDDRGRPPAPPRKVVIAEAGSRRVEAPDRPLSGRGGGLGPGLLALHRGADEGGVEADDQLGDLAGDVLVAAGAAYVR